MISLIIDHVASILPWLSVKRRGFLNVTLTEIVPLSIKIIISRLYISYQPDTTIGLLFYNVLLGRK